MSEPKHYTTAQLARRFWPYLARYRGVLCTDLLCACLTTVCELVLPMLMRAITDRASQSLALLTPGYIARLGLFYLALRLVDAAANYYKSNMGHVMGAYIETDMRRDAFAHLQRLSDNYFATARRSFSSPH